MEPLFLLLVLILLIAGSAFYAASEIAIVSLPQVVVEEIRKTKPKLAKHLDFHRKNAQRFVINISIANNFINILASSLATATLVALFPQYGVLIATVGMTIFILLFGEIIPKVIAINHTKFVASRSAAPLWISAIVLTPFIWVFTQVVKLFSKNNSQGEEVNESALKYYLQKGLDSGAINPTEREYIDNIMQMDEIQVKEIMTPKESVLSVSDKTTVKKAISVLKRSGYSRSPVYRGKNKDDIIGIIHAKDLLGIKETTLIKKYVRKAYVIPENKLTDSLLQDFQRQDSHFAIILSVDGEYLGIVTAEDVIEEIFGEIYDETDQKVVYLKQINRNTYHIQGDFLLADFNKRFTTRYKGANTISGLIVSKLKRIPAKGDVIEISKGTLEVLSVIRNKVRKVKFVVK